MKGLNLKKLATAALGVGLVAGSMASAGLMYEDMQLIDNDGQPVVQVVVGSNAHIMDGVQAARITSVLGNEAFKSTTLTARYLSGVRCIGGGTTEGGTTTGTCAITDERVTLEIESEGEVLTGTGQFKVLIGDILDREIENREVDEWSNTETSDNAGPYAGVHADHWTDSYKIDGNKFAPFREYTVRNYDTGDTWKQYQMLWLPATTKYDIDDGFYIDLDAVIYQSKFDDAEDLGLALCPKSRSTPYDDCNAVDQITRHRVMVQFLGEEWILSDVNLGVGAELGAGNVVGIIPQTSISLAKESAYRIVNVGETLQTGDIQVRLDDIAYGTGADTVYNAIISILDANGNVLSQDQVRPGTTLEKTVQGQTINVHVYQTSPGLTLNVRWAEMAIYANKIELTSGDSIDENENDDFNVDLVWKARQSAANPNNRPTHLRSIIVYNEDFFELYEGESFDFIADPSIISIGFSGLDLRSGDYDQLEFRVMNRLRQKSYEDTIYGIDADERFECNDLIRVTSRSSNAFEFEDRSVSEFYFIPQDCQNLDTVGVANLKGLYAYEFRSGEYKFEEFPSGIGENWVEYRIAGDEDSIGAILFTDEPFDLFGDGIDVTTAHDAWDDLADFGGDDYLIVLRENAGRYDGVSNNAVYSIFKYDGIENYFENSETGQYLDSDESFYLSLFDLYGAYNSNHPSGKVDNPFYTERGTKINRGSRDRRVFDVARRIGQLTFTISTLEGEDSTPTDPSVLRETLREGESITVGGTTVTVISIDQNVGACTASTTGGSVECSVDDSGAIAEIFDGTTSHGSSVESVIKYTINPSALIATDENPTAAYRIAVGGPEVNTVTRDVLAGEVINWQEEQVVVRKIGNTIVVAGGTKEQTKLAVDQFLANLS